MAYLQKPFLKWVLYVSPILILLGIMILVVVIVKPFHVEALLSSPVKRGLVEFIAYFFLLIGFSIGTPLGTKIISDRFDLPFTQIDLIKAQRSYRILENVIYSLLFLFVCLFFIYEKQAVLNLDGTRSYYDTISYTNTATNSIREINFWVGQRPFTIPLFYKLIGYTISNYNDQLMMN